MIHIMYGLPGAGKTHFAMDLYERICTKQKQEKEHNKKKVVYMNLDKQDRLMLSNTTYYGIGNHRTDCLIVDGFFKDTQDLIKRLSERLSERLTWTTIKNNDSVIIHEFEQNKQACIENDRLRNRDQLAINSINEGIKPFNLNTFKVCLEDRFWIEDYKVKKEPVIAYSSQPIGKLYSPWHVGDTITGDFIELDTFLEKNYPSITFLQYKKIISYVHTEEMYTRDYYDKQDTRSVQYSIKYEDILKEIK